MPDLWTIAEADCIEAMRAMPDASIDAVVTDPPYGIGFMGHDWDQPGDFGPVRANGTPSEFAGGRPAEGDHGAGAQAALERQIARSSRRGTQRDPASGAGHERERMAHSRANTQGPGGKREGASFGAATGADNTTHTLRGGAMHAGRYDLSPTANRRFQTWCEAWASEALRVLKPGGHLLVFGSTRTYHRMAAGVEDAGFEIRDCMAWLFGSGFPKSLDVSKAIDRLDATAERDARARRSQEWLRQHVTAQEVDRATGTHMGHHLTTHPTQPFVPTPTMLGQLRPLLPPVPAWLEALVDDRAVESQNMAAREVLAEREGTSAPGMAGDRHRGGEPTTFTDTAPHTPEAEQWAGWGTALKPGHEPIVVARKPLTGTVAANVLAHGTGALNVDGCRIGAGEGRWPANVLLDPEAAAMLDEQAPDTGGGGFCGGGIGDGAVYGAPGSGQTRVTGRIDANGGASRFFYCAKASTAERNAGLVPLDEDDPGRNLHPTVKPIELMRWLVRLTTPAGGTVLDPFTGSGTTGCAAVLEGVNFVGIERQGPAFVEAHPGSDDYVAIARARIAWWAEHPEGVELVKGIEADRDRRRVADAGQIGLFDASAAEA